jgi:hypothetical protein
MRAFSHSADRISTCAVLLGGAGGVLVFVVALPLALSNPFPTPRDGEWIIENPAFKARAAMAPSMDMPLPDAQMDRLAMDRGDRPFVLAALEEPAGPRLTFAERWNLRVPQAAISTAVPAEAQEVEIGEAAPEPVLSHQAELPQAAVSGSPEAAPERKPRSAPPARAAIIGPPTQKRTAAIIQETVDQYLWEVYQRKPVKSDSTGDFTWKDQAAAKRLGMSLRSYVIGGMDPDFREQLYHAGHAMDANGLHWSMLSAFRDDYRQGLAAGFKAHGGNSQHGGSRATGGYGHGRAIDIASAEGEGKGEAIWHWIDAHGARFGLLRPMTRIDPAHIQARGNYHDLAHELREARAKLDDKLGTKTKVATK